MKRNIIITAVASAAAAVITGLVVRSRWSKRYSRLEDDYCNTLDEYADNLKDFTDYVLGNQYCPCDDFLKEDNEDE